MKNFLIETYKDTTNVSRVQENGRIVKESLLQGAISFIKVESVWEENRLITIMFKRGR